LRTSDLIKSKFWRAADLQGQRPPVLTIAHVTEELFTRGGRQEMKAYLWFSDHEKGLSLNATRVKLLEYAYGPETEAWTGCKVRLSFDPTVMFGGKAVGGVKLETSPGVVYSPGAAAQGAWGGAPGAQIPNGRPPAPVWDERAGQWRTPEPIAALGFSVAVKPPPPPVWNPQTGQWEVVDVHTGAVGPLRAAVSAAPAAAQHVAPATISASFCTRSVRSMIPST